MKIYKPFLLLLLLSSQHATASLIIYPAPQSSITGKSFQVKVRETGGSWQDVATYYANVAQSVNAKLLQRKTSFGYFDCSGQVEVSILPVNITIASVKIRPLAKEITPTITGKEIRFFMKTKDMLSIEINGDIFGNLQLFANPLPTENFKAGDKNVRYYGPGVHRIGTVPLPAGTTVYIAGGAIVQGAFAIKGVKQVRILGRGILTQLAVESPESQQQSIVQDKKPVNGRNDEVVIESSSDVMIDGITVLPHKYSILMGQAKNVSITNFKSFSSEGNADGIDIFSSTDIRIDHIFMRNSDDCIAIYGHRWNYYGNTNDITVSNAILWADVAHPINIGTHGNSDQPEVLENITFRKLTVLDQHENQIDYQGCLAINAGDSNTIRTVTFDQVDIEDIRKGQLINFRVMYNKKYNTSAGAGISDILIRDLSYTGTRANLSVIMGYDEKRGIKNLKFENLRINGTFISDTMPGKPGFYKTTDMANILVAEHVENITFTRTK